MRFLVDESTGATVVAYLRSAGHDVLAVATETGVRLRPLSEPV